MSRAVGIDLGTTYSAVATVDEYGKPVVIKNSDSQTTTPSVVYIDPPNYVVGEVALQSTLTDPHRVVQFIKRFMGVKDYRVTVAGREYSPEFVSSIILRKLVQEAEEELGERVTSAVITVPAYFTETQRQATYEAGNLAGLNVLRIINEPTAAALSYGISRRGQRRNILVYDLGGGTFDVTVLAIDNESLNVVAIGGDPHLGGKDWDDRIMNFIEEELKQKFGYELEPDPTLEAELRLKAEAAKRQLTGRPSVPITFKAKRTISTGTGMMDTFIPVRVEITREQFEQITKDLLARTELLIDNVMQQAGLRWADIAETICVGGSSRMPMVKDMLTRMTGRRPLLHDPDECVAKGAALQAALLTKDDTVEEVHVGHVLSHSLGVAAVKDSSTLIDHIIPALTPLPCSQIREGYTTTVDNQEAVQVRIYEGESPDPNAYPNGPIGVFNLDTRPPRPKGQPLISVEFRCDENGRVTAVARDRDTGKESRAAISLVGERNTTEVAEEAQLLAQAVIS
ncbi:MAG: Hsp70 family protein [Armatimonadota bacterium]|nr:Hsp70 family protein [Armatimonadota bacterium]